MSIVNSKAKIELTVTLTLTEIEARALTEMTGYGVEPFLKGYYKYLGKHYIQPYEEGFRLLFKSINTQLPQHIKRINAARKAFNEGTL